MHSMDKADDTQDYLTMPGISVATVIVIPTRLDECPGWNGGNEHYGLEDKKDGTQCKHRS